MQHYFVSQCSMLKWGEWGRKKWWYEDMCLIDIHLSRLQASFCLLLKLAIQLLLFKTLHIMWWGQIAGSIFVWGWKPHHVQFWMLIGVWICQMIKHTKIQAENRVWDHKRKEASRGKRNTCFFIPCLGLHILCIGWSTL